MKIFTHLLLLLLLLLFETEILRKCHEYLRKKAQCLKITEKVSFNILRLLESTKVYQKCQKCSILASFWKYEACGQTVLLDRSILKGQKLMKSAKSENIKCIFWFFSVRHFLGIFKPRKVGEKRDFRLPLSNSVWWVQPLLLRLLVIAWAVVVHILRGARHAVSHTGCGNYIFFVVPWPW